MFVAILTVFLAGVLASLLATELGRRGRIKALISIGTGYLVGLAIMGLIPHAFEKLNRDVWVTIPLVLVGALCVWLTERLVAWFQARKSRGAVKDTIETGHQHHQHQHRISTSLKLDHKACCAVDSVETLPVEVAKAAIWCIVVCAFFDGLALSAALLSGEIAIYAYSGILAHAIPEAMLVGLIAKTQFQSTLKSVWVSFGVAAAFALGNGLSHVAVVRGLSEGGLLGLAGGMIIYISFAHMIPKFVSRRTEGVFAGIGFIMFLIANLAHQH